MFYLIWILTMINSKHPTNRLTDTHSMKASGHQIAVIIIFLNVLYFQIDPIFSDFNSKYFYSNELQL